MRAGVEAGGGAGYTRGLDGIAKVVDTPAAIGHDLNLRAPNERRVDRGRDTVEAVVGVPASLNEADVGDIGRVDTV